MAVPSFAVPALALPILLNRDSLRDCLPARRTFSGRPRGQPLHGIARQPRRPAGAGDARAAGERPRGHPPRRGPAARTPWDPEGERGSYGPSVDRPIGIGVRENRRETKIEPLCLSVYRRSARTTHRRGERPLCSICITTLYNTLRTT